MKSPKPQEIGHLAAQSLSVGQREIQTQKRVLAFSSDALGYAYLGHWMDRDGNANVEDTVRSFKEMLEGKRDNFPEDAFYMVGTIEEAIEKAAKIASDG